MRGRWGGFYLRSVLSQAAAPGALVFTARVRAKIREAPRAAGPHPFWAGLAPWQPGLRSPDHLIAGAHAALYQAKRAGRDSVRIHQPMQASA
jgi:PleD family two-component response regulator